MILFSEFYRHDLRFLGKILIFLGFLGKINCQDLGKKSGKPKILATSGKNLKSWQEIQYYLRLSKILARKPRRQALGYPSIANKISKRSRYLKTPPKCWSRCIYQEFSENGKTGNFRETPLFTPTFCTC